MAGVALISAPPPRSPSQTLSDIGIVLPSLHLGSFSKMTFDSITPTSEETRRSPISQSPGPSFRARALITTSQGDDPVMSEQHNSALNGRASASNRTTGTRRRREDIFEEDSPSAALAQCASLRPLFTPSSGSYPGRPLELPTGALDPTVQQPGSTVPRVDTASAISGDDSSRNRASDAQLKVVNGPRRIDSAEYKYDTPVSVRAPSLQQYPSPSSNSPPAQMQSADAPLKYAAPPMVQNPSSPPALPNPKVFMRPQIAQKVVPREEVCVECMLRDRDMADVDVTSPGVWERESDVWYEELVRREQQEARDRIPPSANSNKPQSQGGHLTEGNLMIWLTMNPKEPAARWQTLEKYIKSQAEFLAAELQAQEQTLREAHLRDSKMREAYHHLRRSTADIGRVPIEDSSSGVKLRASTDMDDPVPRDVTLLESGLILERVDIRRQQKEERERKKADERTEKRRTRKMSRISVPDIGPGFGSDASSMHSLSNPLQNVSYGSRSQISLSTPSISANKRLSSPLTLSPPLPLRRGQSQNSMEPGTPRFLGFKHWRGAYGSEASLHNNSGSMMDMHLGLEQDRDAVAPFDDEPWSAIQLVDEAATLVADEVVKPKKHTIKRLWKKMTGKDKDNSGSRAQRPQEDLDVPLDPPPSLSYLVNRSNGHERSPHVRHASSPPVQSSGPSSPQPRSPSLSVRPPLSPATGASISSLSAISLRDGPLGEERRHSGPIDELEPAIDDGSRERRERIPGIQTYSGKSRSVTYPTPEPWRQSVYPSPTDATFSLQHIGSSIQPQSTSSNKELPPLPDETFYAVRNQPTLRPFTTYDTPSPPFKTEARRQSFSDLFSRPVTQTLGNFLSRSRKNSEALVPPPPLFGTFQVDEFGASAPSLVGRWEDEPSHYAALSLSLSPTKSEKSSKRQSRFTSGLSSIFGGSSSSAGRRSAEREMQLRDAALGGTGLAPNDGRIYPRFADEYLMSRASRSEVAFRNSSASLVTFSRPSPSSVSSKRFDSLIPQESDFIALRYPTESERVDLVRQF